MGGGRGDEHLVLELLEDILLLLRVGLAGWITVGGATVGGSGGDDTAGERSSLAWDCGHGSSEDGEDREKRCELHCDL